MELAGKTKASKPTNSGTSTSAASTSTTTKSSATASTSTSSSSNQKIPRETVFSSSELPTDNNSFNKGLRSIKLTNIIVVIRGLIALILEMDFTVNMDLFLLTCKVSDQK